MLLFSSGISGSCTLLSSFSHLLSFQTTSLCCENCSAVIPPSSTISEAAQLSNILRTANLVVLHTLMIKAEKEIPRCLTALEAITGFHTWKSCRSDVSNRFCIQMITNRTPFSFLKTHLSQNCAEEWWQGQKMWLSDKNLSDCQWDDSMHTNQEQPTVSGWIIQT